MVVKLPILGCKTGAVCHSPPPHKTSKEDDYNVPFKTIFFGQHQAKTKKHTALKNRPKILILLTDTTHRTIKYRYVNHIHIDSHSLRRPDAISFTVLFCCCDWELKYPINTQAYPEGV